MRRHRKLWVLIVGLCAVLLVVGPPIAPASAQANELIGGVGDIIGGALSIPIGVLAGTLNGPPILGTVGGALAGMLNTLSLTTRGVLRLLGVAIPIAGRLVPLLPVFL